ncbi:conserved hypothetical protein [Rippkaea orientalis PCC 8801]|uniref:Uncharacterized protein n=1 Tax=Rippkaea orientalis (strain PCC 8801 / RF-1) TaxID=41431 RepID=B7JZF7_RIPO1|nr:hypothetical protein [Rippkaea orientalis]ACK67368.1 conserved hypothetical protein [Rippkaea orientalis PCC 8801]
MHIIQTQVKISRDHILNVVLPDNIAEGTYQVVIVMSPQAENELYNDETPDEVAIEGITEGLKQAFTNQTIPLSQIDISKNL